MAIHWRVFNSFELISLLCDLTFSPGDALAILERFISLAALFKPNETKLVHCMLSRNYARCLDQLVRVDDRLRTPCSRKILDLWRKLGKRLPITEIIEFPAPFQQKYWDPKPWETCHNLQCICNSMRLCHKMKVCKGCWGVRYCCTKCQKRSVPIDMYMPHIFSWLLYQGLGRRSSKGVSPSSKNLRLCLCSDNWIYDLGNIYIFWVIV